MENKNLENVENIVEESIENEKPKKPKKPSIFSKFIALMKSRKTKYGSLSIAITAIVIALVILINMAFSMLTEKFPNIQIDFTLSQTYQLQEDTVDYISKLDQDVTINILASKDGFAGGLNGYGGAEYFVQAQKLLNKIDALVCRRLLAQCSRGNLSRKRAGRGA